MIAVVLALLIVPLAAGLISAALLTFRTLPAKLAPAVTVISGVACFALVLTLIPAVAHEDLNYLSYLRIDAVSAIFLLATSGCEPPMTAQLVRVLHAELERIANHLDVAVRLADAAGLAVATARLALHKERVLRLVSGLCGSRFGRGVVVPGGVSARPLLPPAEIRAEIDRLAEPIAAEAAALMATSSFLDRLRGTGPLTPARARQHGALGPIGKAAGYADDARLARPYDAYPALAVPPARAHIAGDAMARLRLRWEEVDQSFRLIRQVTDHWPERSCDPPRVSCEPRGRDAALSGRAAGWAEAPQGEVIYDVTLAAGRIVRCHPRSASFHNLVLMHEVFAGDILTDFPFIEASFGLSVAGVAL